MVAPRIIWRYILRDVLLHSLLGLAVMSLLLIVQNVLRFMEELVSVGAGLGTLAQLVSMILPSYLSYAIPTALLFGILLSFGRMSADGEIVAIRASGVSVPTLLPPVLALAAVAALATGVLLFRIEPRSYDRMKTLVAQLASSANIIEPGEFRPVGERMLYVHERGDPSCPLSGVLISDFSDPDRSLYVSARCGDLIDEKSESGAESVALELTEGSVHFALSDDSRYRKIRFVTMRTQLDLSAVIHSGKRARDYTFSELLDLDQRFESGEPLIVRGGREGVQLQIQRRLAFPFASVLLAMVAVPLGIRPLRSGRSAGALTAIAVMAAYWCMFSAGEIAAEGGYAPAWLALWTPNMIVLGVGIWLMRRTIRDDS